MDGSHQRKIFNFRFLELMRKINLSRQMNDIEPSSFFTRNIFKKTRFLLWRKMTMHSRKNKSQNLVIIITRLNRQQQTPVDTFFFLNATQENVGVIEKKRPKNLGLDWWPSSRPQITRGSFTSSFFFFNE